MYSYSRHSKLKQVVRMSSICLDKFSDSCDQRTCNLTKHCSITDASCSAQNSLEQFFSHVHLVWASSVNKMLWIIWGLELIQWHNSNRLHKSAGSRCWMCSIWYGYIPSVCNVHQTIRVEVNTSGLNSRANSESEMSLCKSTHGSDLQRLLSLEQLKCSSSFYPWCSQQYKKLPFMGSW
jgi:hypothetical protein